MARKSLEFIGKGIQDLFGMSDAQADTAKYLAGYVPILGSAIDVYDAINDPNSENIGWAALGVATDILGGRVVAKAAKSAKTALKTQKAINSMSKAEKATELRHAGDRAVRLAEQRGFDSGVGIISDAERNTVRAQAENILQREWNNATRRTTTIGRRAKTRHTAIVPKYNILDTYAPYAVGWLGMDFTTNTAQRIRHDAKLQQQRQQ